MTTSAIHVIPSTFDCLNMGDAAMLQTAVSRLSALFPDASIRVPTSDPVLLKRLCPSSDPQPRNGASRRPVAAARVQRAISRALGAASPKRDASPAPLRPDTALVVASGAGGINDVFASYSHMVLSTLEDAFRRRVPTALLSHGFGPLQDEELLERARVVLPRVDLIALREGVSGPRLLDALGVDPARVRTTGDDAVAAAYESRPDALGRGIGVNVRVSSNASVEESDLRDLGPILRRLAARHDAPLLPVPISRKGGVDANAIQAVVGICDGDGLDTPAAVIRQVGLCRVVVTGAYHAAVFALAQGIPAVCLHRSAYFEKKFVGLADLFGAGCAPVALEPGWPAEVESRLEAAWSGAEAFRSELLESAQRQIRLGREAYGELKSIVEGRGRG
jgi:polysaccharide pyruvyl transferase WcaK-like protein